MKPPPVGYARVDDIEQAVAVLGEHGGEAKVLAGGQSLVPLLNFRLARPAVLVDVNRVGELDFVREENGHLVVGAMTRQRELETSTAAATAVPLLPEVLRHVGHVTNRNRGTVGGSVAHADPAAELPTLLTGLGGEVVAQGSGGSRTVPAEEFFVGTFTTALDETELLTAVRFPRLPAGTGVAVEELARRHGDFAIVAAMAAVHRGEDGRVDLVRLAASGVASVPVRLHAAEAVLSGQEPTAEAIEAAAATVADSINPTGDVHAPAHYRRDMAGVLVRRVLRAAVERSEKRA